MDGFLIINKPLGYTSRDVVNHVSKALKTKKVGHTGTLDPNASGILIIAIGKALKLIELMNDDDKEYMAEVILGIETDTLDTDSNATILRSENVNLDDVVIRDTVASFKGTYMQEVPKYSAVKVNGRKLYEYARNNIPVELPKREVDIKAIDIIGDIKRENGRIVFKIKTTVSKGTYIRSLVRDIGVKLNVPAVMNTLVRTRIGKLSLDDAYSLDDIMNGNYHLITITDMFNEISTIPVDNDTALKVSNGVVFDNLFNDNLAFITDDNGKLLALYKLENGKNRPYKVFV